MSSISVFSKAGLPAVTSLSTALRNLETEVGVTGVAILKMDKTGHWVFGADQTEAEEDSRWAVNPFSFTHGFIAWGDGDVLAETMVAVAEPLLADDAARDRPLGLTVTRHAHAAAAGRRTVVAPLEGRLLEQLRSLGYVR